MDETRGSFTVESGDLAVNERNFDWQAHTLQTRGTFWILKNVNMLTRDIWEENYFWGKTVWENFCMFFKMLYTFPEDDFGQKKIRRKS